MVLIGAGLFLNVNYNIRRRTRFFAWLESEDHRRAFVSLFVFLKLFGRFWRTCLPQCFGNDAFKRDVVSGRAMVQPLGDIGPVTSMVSFMVWIGGF
jgi:hypothetical protein